MPNLTNSLKHIAVIGKFSLERPTNRRHVEIAAGADRDKAFREIGFELVYGAQPITIDLEPRLTFGISAPAAAPKEWFETLNEDGTTEKVIPKSIPLVEAKPLIDSFREGTTASQIGGKLFGTLLNDLDGLRSSWSPQFDRALTVAAFYWIRAKTEGGVRVLTDGQLRDLLFLPEINRRLLSCLRATAATEAKAASSFEQVLEKNVLAKSLPLGLGEHLKSLRRAFASKGALNDSNRPFDSVFASADPKAQDAKAELAALLPSGLTVDASWRAYIGYAEGVHRLAGCEPLFAFIIMWFFSKVAGETTLSDKVAEALYEELYADKEDIAVLPKAERLADQETFRSAMKEAQAEYQQRRKTTRSQTVLTPDTETDPLVSFAESLTDTLIADVEVGRGPSPSFTRKQLVDAATKSLRVLLPYGISEGKVILSDLSKRNAELQEAYRPFEAVYGDGLTLETLETIKASMDGAPRALWESVLAKLKEGKLAGKALGDGFRHQYNSQWAVLIHSELESAIEKIQSGLGKKLIRIIEHYRHAVATLSGDASVVGIAGGSHTGVGKKSETTKQKESTPEAMTMSASPTSVQDQSRPAVEGAKPADSDGTETEKVSGSEAQGKGQVAYDQLAEGFTIEQLGRHPNANDSLNDRQALIVDRAEFDNVREAIVQGLSTGDAKLAMPRGTLRALLFAETILSTPDDMSPLKKKHSSLGVPFLLELISAVGAVPNRESKEDREDIALPAKDLECGVKSVKLHGIYPLPKDPEQATKELETHVKYWQELAARVLGAREYIEEVDSVRRLATAVKGQEGVRITVHNEILEEHVRRSGKDLVFASRNDPKQPGAMIEPPSYVWLTSEAKVDSLSLGELQKEAEYEIGVLATDKTKSTVCLSYPLYLLHSAQQNFVVPNNLLLSSSPPSASAPWDLVDLLICLIGLEQLLEGSIPLEKAIRNELTALTGTNQPSDGPKGRYYSSIGVATLGLQLLQSRVLTAGLFLRLASDDNPLVFTAVKQALKSGPLTPELTHRFRQKRETGEWGAFNEQTNAPIDSLGWFVRENPDETSKPEVAPLTEVRDLWRSL